MSNNQPSDIFVERISNVSHANGVFRITLGVNDSPNDIRPVTCLMVPANQLGPMLQGIANAAKNIGEQDQVLITGGGAYNDYLIDRIKNLTNSKITIPDPKIIEYKEALIFSFLGLLRVLEINNCYSSVTGAKKDHCSGKIYNP